MCRNKFYKRLTICTIEDPNYGKLGPRFYPAFNHYLHKFVHVIVVGDVFKRLMPPKEYFTRALYTFDIGQNDLGAGFFGNKSIAEVNASVPTILSRFSTDVKVNVGFKLFFATIIVIIIINFGTVKNLNY